MKKLAVVFLSVILLVVSVGAACADVQAHVAGSLPTKNALVAYVGTDAFTKLNAGERQACVEWLAVGGAMGPECKKAVMRLIALAPDAVTDEQRQALVLAASGSVAYAPVGNADTPVIVEKQDDTGAIIAGGLFGLLAGLVIANNTGRHHHYVHVSPHPRPPDFRRGPHGPFGGPKWRPRLPPHKRVHIIAPKRPPKGGRPPRR